MLHQAPRNMHIPNGVHSARPTFDGPFTRVTKGRKGAAGAGLRYESKVQQSLMAEFPSFVPGPWICYRESNFGPERWCQPDGLFFNLKRNSITIAEIKLKHTERAWWQLKKLYLPVVRKVFGNSWEYRLLEICRWFDPAVPTPEPMPIVETVFPKPMLSVLVYVP